jgi:hypothetical protein
MIRTTVILDEPGREDTPFVRAQCGEHRPDDGTFGVGEAPLKPRGKITDAGAIEDASTRAVEKLRANYGCDCAAPKRLKA